MILRTFVTPSDDMPKAALSDKTKGGLFIVSARKNKIPRLKIRRGIILLRKNQSHCASDLTAAEASGTCIYVTGSTVNDSLNSLDVGLPSSVGASVRVAHLDAERNTLIAKFALCHLMLHLLAKNI